MARYDICLLSGGKVDLTAACIESIYKAGGDYRLVWVDNAPDVGRTLWHDTVVSIGMKCSYHAMPENLGFTKAMNVALSISTAPYVVILNDDTEVPSGWLESLKSGFINDSVAAVGPLSTSKGQWQGNTQPGRGIQRVKPNLSLSGAAIGGPMLAFFCTMISRAAIEDIGLLDEWFSPGFGEDDDWCARAHLQGWDLMLNTDITVKHRHRSTWAPERVRELQARNCKRLQDKYRGKI